MKRLQSTLPLFLALLAGSALAQTPAPPAAPTAPSAPVAAPAKPSAALQRGLDTVDANEIRSDLYFIADDEMQGRDTPSPGLRIAARFLRARLERLGFQPLGDDGGWFAHYHLHRFAPDIDASQAEIVRGTTRTVLHPGQDYSFFGTGKVDAEGPVVYVGGGSDEELGALDLTGKWALTSRQDDGGGRRGREAWGAAEGRLRQKGAIGRLVGPDPAAADAEGRGGVRPMSDRFLRPVLRESDEVYPTVMLGADATKALVGDALPAVGTELDARFHEVRALKDDEDLTLENVAGFWPGSDLADQVIIVSAHYDHVGVQNGEIYNGADDNGSGTCGMLALAEALKAYGPMRRSVLLLWVSGEEKGLLGSAAWTEHPTLHEGQRAVCDLNIDMIGRNAPDELEITPTHDHPAYNALTRMAEANAPLEGFPVLGSADEYWRRSDHMNFSVNLGIPVAFLFSDVHEDYHKPTDTPDKIDYDKIHRVVRLVLRMLDGLQGDSLDL